MWAKIGRRCQMVATRDSGSVRQLLIAQPLVPSEPRVDMPYCDSPRSPCLAKEVNLGDVVCQARISHLQAGRHLNEDGTVSLLAFAGGTDFDLIFSPKDAKRIASDMAAAVKKTK